MPTTTEQVTDRPTRCAYCKHEAPVGTPIASLAFFERRGPGTQDDRCRRCRYMESAHDASLSDFDFQAKHGWAKPIGLRDPKHMPPISGGGRCPGFEPMTEGYTHDGYYCGCRGWD